MRDDFSDIPGSAAWKRIRPITEGWSDDQKYFVQTDRGEAFLLRVCEGQSREREQVQDSALRSLSTLDIPVSRLVAVGPCQQGRCTYRLFTWIPGTDLRESLDSFSTAQQYAYGLRAGQILRAIHQIASPPDIPPWGTHYRQKIVRKITAFRECGIHVPQVGLLLDFVQAQSERLDERPSCFQHGDFHIGNMVLKPQQELAVIDFNRLDFGDPWEEFNRITWSASRSPAFASGQINGYFDGEVPGDFFPLMALYIAVNQLGAIPWAIPYGQREVAIMLEQTEAILTWFDYFAQPVPRWYQSPVT